ncbi:hypothetical protein OSSY52_02150 [Tepiditoga spiralis]|uniref:CAAX prenyl protease 2/Lysostaphin resistance protein A-like domain-containing protein n=1 Tax=Tepiditoga spiralis TaxID=2108365 RepID=A0A7G1G4X8_9BACT|nr:CPBP family intramembrane glutamic endopeptidase [Tepiditoga spiralis]BBE30074.1 hypothetical protein OSSY52_02150 [Tepiditoga spiralis]
MKQEISVIFIFIYLMVTRVDLLNINNFNYSKKDFFLFFINSLIFFIINYLLELKNNNYKYLFKNISKKSIYLYLFKGIIFIPILEEILYRGILISILIKIFNSYIAVIISSIIFMFQHKFYNFYQYIFLFLIAMILGIYFLIFNSIIPTILIHSVINMANYIYFIKNYKNNKKKEWENG